MARAAPLRCPTRRGHGDRRQRIDRRSQGPQRLHGADRPSLVRRKRRLGSQFDGHAEGWLSFFKILLLYLQHFAAQESALVQVGAQFDGVVSEAFEWLMVGAVIEAQSTPEGFSVILKLDRRAGDRACDRLSDGRADPCIGATIPIRTRGRRYRQGS